MPIFRNSNLTNSLKYRDLTQSFKHSLLEVIVMLACATILIVLASIILFIAIQGGKYFLPMSAYEVTRYSPNHSQEHYAVENNSNSIVSVEYVLSHRSLEELVSDIEQKLNQQFLDNDIDRPVVTVSEASELFLLSTRSGKDYLGEFISLQHGEVEFDNLSQLLAIKDTVALLEQNLDDIQVNQLKTLHREIAALDNKQVSKETPLYQKKLDEFKKWQQHVNNISAQIQEYRINLRSENQQVYSIAISELQNLYQPNKLSLWQSIGFSVNKVIVFLTDFPKQASTSGGVFPAIFGTMLMVIIMAVVVTPFGAIAAIYLHEYAPPTRLTEIIRVCVSNMAAVPSVVYGVFGLGFFVYALGGSIDELFYAQELPSPTFGSPGLLWASLTMGILTLPVVIVSTEEGLSRVPENLRLGALALGATKFETIVKVVLPIASPGILTGIILAIARAAGEVAPLILVGAVKFAPTLPIDSEFPFVHFERQFMHLGVFIYDGAFHNQTESQVSSLMFATCFLLLIIVILLNLTAIVMRNSLRNKYERL